MSRKTYGCLAIARRHPRLFAAMYRDVDPLANARREQDRVVPADPEVARVMLDLGFDRRTADRHVAQRRHLQGLLRKERRAFANDMEHS